jgi:Escherichia/Staphylococcus phage prohead protease
MLLPAITGYAAVFGAITRRRGVLERIAPGAFRRALLYQHTIFALVGHDWNRELGTTRSGTLRLAEDSHGLRVQIWPDYEQRAARDLLRCIRSGQMRGMSFGFGRGGELVDRRIIDSGTGQPLRELIEIPLVEVSAVYVPAYPQTEVHLDWCGLDPRTQRACELELIDMD